MFSASAESMQDDAFIRSLLCACKQVSLSLIYPCVRRAIIKKGGRSKKEESLQCCCGNVVDRFFNCQIHAYRLGKGKSTGLLK